MVLSACPKTRMNGFFSLSKWFGTNWVKPFSEWIGNMCCVRNQAYTQINYGSSNHLARLQSLFLGRETFSVCALFLVFSSDQKHCIIRKIVVWPRSARCSIRRQTAALCRDHVLDAVRQPPVNNSTKRKMPSSKLFAIVSANVVWAKFRPLFRVGWLESEWDDSMSICMECTMWGWIVWLFTFHISSSRLLLCHKWMLIWRLNEANWMVGTLSQETNRTHQIHLHGGGNTTFARHQTTSNDHHLSLNNLRFNQFRIPLTRPLTSTGDVACSPSTYLFH